MLIDIAFAFWFLLPAAIANVTPIFASRIPGLKQWNTPLDGGKRLRGKEILGTHKTWRGIITGLITATIVFALQQQAYIQWEWVRELSDPANYQQLPLILGTMLGLGALGGDAIESFFKRQFGIKSGNAWVPFDQIDYIIGAILLSLLFIVLPFHLYIIMAVVWFLMHLISSYIGWLLGLKKKPI
ncbi:MAG: hypothetical protein JWN33_490 [Candidatus Saccharibacteria bacterium]|nr:hypothetical protein [Candidatus Saccharibacteria bacterium]